MKSLAKLPLIVLLFFFLIVYFGLEFIGLENPVIRASIAGAISFILSPKRKKIQAQTGEKTQITWIFLKEPIILD